MHDIQKRLVALGAALALGAAACSGAATAAPSSGGGSPAPGGGASASASGSGGAAGINANAKTVTFSWGTFTLAQRIIDKAANGDPLNIVVDNQGTAVPIFGAEQKIGVDRGCATNKSRINMTCRLTGPAQADQTAQLAELETLLTSNQVDCLGLQSPLPDAFVDVINKYVAAGIPVFTENTDVPNSHRFAFFALNEVASGTASGVATATLVKAQGLNIDTIAMGSGGPAGQWAQDRMTGFEAGYKTLFPAAKFFNDPKSAIPTGADFTTQEVIDSVGPFLAGHPNVNLFFHTDQGVEGVGDIIQSKGLQGKVWTSGFNVSLPILDSIDAGNTLVTINQGFDNQAEAAVTACTDFLADGKLPPDPLAYLKAIVITKNGGPGQQTSADARTELMSVTASPSP